LTGLMRCGVGDMYRCRSVITNCWWWW